MKIKQLSLLVAIAATALAAAAGQPERIDVEAGAFHPVLSPDGSTLLYSTVDHHGLKAMNLAQGTVSVIDTEAAAGFNPVFSADGSRVFYRTASLVDGLVYRDVRSCEPGGSPMRVAEPSRGDVNLQALGANTYAYADYRDIKVAVNGRETAVSPLEDAHSYLWASLSPDGSMMSFSEPFMGVYISSPDGTSARKVLDKGDYVAWAGPSTIIAVVSKDDGYVTTESRLVAVNVNTGITSVLTPADMKVGEATASAGGIVVFSDINGNMYKLDLNR